MERAPIEKHAYLALLRADSQALASAARLGLTTAVPSCPGWSMADLIVHTGGVHRAQAHIVATRAQEPTGLKREMFDSVPGLLPWLESSTLMGGESNLAAIPPGLVDWFEEGAATLTGVLEAAYPGEPVWSWSENKRVAHYLRMMPIETAVHRWDAQCANRRPEPIERTLAIDGIDHTFEVMMPFRRAHGNALAGQGESYHFRRTDGPGDWILRFDGEATIVRNGDGETDVSVAGTASDLFLFLWKRLRPEDLEVEGDARLLARYFELVPPL